MDLAFCKKKEREREGETHETIEKMNNLIIDIKQLFISFRYSNILCYFSGMYKSIYE
jgi:hypothetical protein